MVAFVDHFVQSCSIDVLRVVQAFRVHFFVASTCFVGQPLLPEQNIRNFLSHLYDL